MSLLKSHTVFYAILLLSGNSEGFAFVKQLIPFGLPRTSTVHKSLNDRLTVGEEATAVRAPLKFVGPYPCLGLRFPDLATSSQRSRNVSGVSLDFVFDTAANTNTINSQVAKELDLRVVGSALPGVGTSGLIQGGDTYYLGDCQLEGVEEPFIFMQNLTASALPIASPASAGLLSLAFLYCFEGVEFNWGSQVLEDGMIKNPPSATFFAEKDRMLEDALSGMTCVKINPIPVTQLPSVNAVINGVEMPALLDTGSPVTVLNSQAAQQAGIETASLPVMPQPSNNPFAAAANRFKAAQAAAQAAAKSEILTIAGADGNPTYLLKSREPTEINFSGENGSVSFGEGPVYVGDIPGLAALNGIGVNSPPAVVLGMDVLRRRPKLMIRARDNQVYF